MSGLDGRPCQLTVCRGCCCGTTKKVPGVDHEAQFARLSAIDDHAGRPVPIRTSTCLGICFQANVVIVQPSREGRAAGGRPVWLGEMTEDALLEAVDDWIFEGGPGIAPVPDALVGHVTSKDAEKPKKSKKPKKDKQHKKDKHAKAAKAAKKAAKAERKAREAGADGGEPKDGKKKDKQHKKDRKVRERRAEEDRLARSHAA